MPSSSTSAKGGWWVVAQFALMAVVLVLGVVPPIWPDWVRALGIAVTLAGAALAIWAGRTLGSSLTPFPRPRADGELVERGPYAIVRHPIYAAGTLFFLGYGLLSSIPATVGVAALAALWHFKAQVEERHLAEQFPAYEDYRRRVRWRILPYLV